MKLNWFSPVPPASTEIANHTIRVVSELRKHTTVTIHTTQDRYNEDIGVQQYALDAYDWKSINEADANFYNIGNNTDFHADIWEVSRRHSGIVILHDYALQHFFAGYFVGVLKRPEWYADVMQQEYGVSGLQAATEYLSGALNTDAMASRFPLASLAVRNSLGIVVHTRAAYDALSKTSIVPLRHISLPYRFSPPDVFTRWIEKKNARPDMRRRLVVFGYLGPNRRLDAILEALAGLPERDEFLLDIYGEVWDPNHVRERIKQHRLKRIVRFHGYVEDLDDRLASADLAINLRYPSMGEASATQLRIWDHALPSLVTKTGWYAELSREAVAVVRPDAEVEDLRHHLRAFLQDPLQFERMGRNGREILITEHSPEKYASALLESAQQAGGFNSCAAWLRTADRVGNEMRHWLPAEPPECIDRISAEISHLATPDIV
jgi:glycosyltransferase involved in cell wall biosynthesis